MGIFRRGRPSRQAPPHKPGLYRFRDRNTGEIDYIGETVNLAHRIGEHFRSPKPVSPKTHHAEWQMADGRSTSRPAARMSDLKSTSTSRDRTNAMEVVVEGQNDNLHTG